MWLDCYLIDNGKFATGDVIMNDLLCLIQSKKSIVPLNHVPL